MSSVISADEARERGRRRMWPFEATITHWMLRVRIATLFNCRKVHFGYSPNRTRVEEAMEYMRELGYEVMTSYDVRRLRESVVVISWEASK